MVYELSCNPTYANSNADKFKAFLTSSTSNLNFDKFKKLMDNIFSTFHIHSFFFYLFLSVLCITQ